MRNDKISIPWQDYCRMVISILMMLLGPILVYRCLSVSGAYSGIILGIALFIYGIYRLSLIYLVIHGKSNHINK